MRTVATGYIGGASTIIGAGSATLTRVRGRDIALSLIICYPANVYLPKAAAICLTLGGLATLVAVRRYPRPPLSMVVSALVTLAYVFVAILSGRDWTLCLMNSRHIFQFFFFAYVLQAAFHDGAFEPERLVRFLPYLVVGHLASALLPAAGVGQQEWEDNPPFYEHNLLTFFTIFALIRVSDRKLFRFATPCLVAYILALTLLTNRISVIALSVFILSTLVLRPHPLILAVASMALLLFPIYTALSATPTEMVMANDIHHDTYMRMEFIRSAYSVLKDHLVFGVGFGTPWRSGSFDYLTQHVLFTDPEQLAAVSNHHSLFDTYFRFGLIFGTVFMWPFYQQIFSWSRDRAIQVGTVFLSVGLSFNAYFENHNEISLVAFVVAMTIAEAERRRRGAVALGAIQV